MFFWTEYCHSRDTCHCVISPANKLCVCWGMGVNRECDCNDIVRLVAFLLLYRDVTFTLTSCDAECTLFECALRIYRNCCSPFCLESDVVTDDERKDK